MAGPALDVIEGDKVRANFTNNLDEIDGHPLPRPDAAERMDGVPHVTQDPIQPGGSVHLRVRRADAAARTCTTRTTTPPTRSGAGCSARSSSSRRTRPQRYDQLYGATQDIVWISNDSLGGFTINGRGFPATSPIVAKLGETIVIRFMNEGNMMHPWHLHGMPMRVVARDGYPLGTAAFTCDTLGVNPGERWDVVIECDEPGAWAFHCHILPHAEGPDGMFGMVTALVVQEPSAIKAAPTEGPVVTAARAAGSTALIWVPATG